MAHFFEIVELSNGDVILRRSDDLDNEALVSIRFSESAKAGLQANHLDIARVMLEAGVRKVGELSGLEVERDDFDTPEQSTQLH